MGTIHKPTKKVWQGVLIMSELIYTKDMKKLKQYERDAILRAVQWAEKMKDAHESEQLVRLKREDDRRAALRAERILAQQMDRKSDA
tara:strand:+ start:805 stop:1065 length:261 start_codon:yes stop_codon:yes gene_type:complete